MKNLSLTFCLAIAALLASVGGGSAGSDLFPCSLSGYKHNCHGVWNFDNGDKYVGEFKNNLPHGKGTFTVINEYKYKGEWKNGVMEGRGVLTSVLYICIHLLL